MKPRTALVGTVFASLISLALLGYALTAYAGGMDDDNDGYPNALESTIGTNPQDDCPATTTTNDEPLDAVPPDMDDNGAVNLLDVLPVLPPVFGTSTANPDPDGDGTPEYAARRDLQPDGVVNVLDVFTLLPPTFGWTCDPEY